MNKKEKVICLPHMSDFGEHNLRYAEEYLRGQYQRMEGIKIKGSKK
ncbi:MAG: hypothetical protein ACI4A5_03840 [Hominilimicola sp.]